MAHDVVNTSLEGCHDMFMHEGSPSLGCNDVIPNPLDFHVSTMCLQPSSFPELDFDVPIDRFKLCDFNVDLGYDDNMFHMLGGNVDHFEFLGYLSALDPYRLSLMGMPRKSRGAISLIFL